MPIIKSKEDLPPQNKILEEEPWIKTEFIYTRTIKVKAEGGGYTVHRQIKVGPDIVYSSNGNYHENFSTDDLYRLIDLVVSATFKQIASRMRLFVGE